MSAQLICTIDGKRTHIGVIIPRFGWAPICGQPSGRDAWGRHSILQRLGRSNRTPCIRCGVVAAELFQISCEPQWSRLVAASTEER